MIRITHQGELSEVPADSLHRRLLSNDKCYLLDCESEVYVWMGRGTSMSERKKSVSTAEVRSSKFGVIRLSFFAV